MDSGQGNQPPRPPLDRQTETQILVDLLKPRLDQLVVCLSHSWGGLEQVAANDAVDVGGLGLKVRVLVLEGSPIHESLAHKKEVTVLPIDWRPRNYFDFKMKAELERLISPHSGGVNLIHTHQTSLIVSIVPWLWRRPDVAMVATRHIMSWHNKKNFFHRAFYRRLDCLMVISRSLKLNVMQTHPIRERFVRVVNLGRELLKRINLKRFEGVGVFGKNRVDVGLRLALNSSNVGNRVRDNLIYLRNAAGCVFISLKFQCERCLTGSIYQALHFRGGLVNR